MELIYANNLHLLFLELFQIIAPTVWAIVFKVRIIIKGSSIESLSFSSLSANFLPSLIFIFIKVGFTLRRTASKIEHKKERQIVKKP